MSKIMYFLTHFGILYTIVSVFDRFIFKTQNAFSRYLLRLRAKLTRKYIKKNYKHIVERYRETTSNTEEIGVDVPIWICWWQGKENMPELAKKCVQSIRKYAGNHRVIIIDKDNVSKYIEIPDFMVIRMDAPNAKIACYVDWIRLRLIYEYGGLWMDITTYVIDDIDVLIGNSSFFTAHHEAVGKWHPSKGKWASGYLGGSKGDPVMGFTAEILYEYYKVHTVPMFYLFIDCVFEVGYEEIPAIRSEFDTVPVNTSEIFKLSSRLNKEYDKELFVSNGQNIINKLTYKKQYQEQTYDCKMTNYGFLKRKDLKRKHGK